MQIDVESPIPRVEFPGIIFYSKSLRGFTAVIRPAMSINEIFIHPRDMLSSDNFQYVSNRRYLCSIAFARLDVTPRHERSRNRNWGKSIVYSPINLDLLRQGKFRSRKGFSQLNPDATAVAIVDYDRKSRR